MSEALLFSSSATKSGKVKLPAEFTAEVNTAVMHDAVRAFLSNLRQGTHATKTRAEVTGGSRKPWRQKGTGRARQGTIRAAHWRGGGIVFGPRPRSYRIDLPRKVRRRARASALSQRASEKSVYVVESFDFDRPKTSKLLELLDKMKLGGKKVVILTDGDRRDVFLSGRNVPNVHVMRYTDVTAYEILWSNALVVEQSALDAGVKRTGAARQEKADG